MHDLPYVFIGSVDNKKNIEKQKQQVHFPPVLHNRMAMTPSVFSLTKAGRLRQI